MDSMHRVDEFRRGSSEVENNLIDALSAGRISRKEFIRRGTVLGLSLSALSFIASACGGDDDDESATGGTGTTEGQANAGGTLRTGIITPAIELNPLEFGLERIQLRAIRIVVHASKDIVALACSVNR